MVPTSMLAVSSRRRGAAESLGDMAYRQIKKKIIGLELPPASLIDESQLVKDLDVGLTPVRQALRRLAHENLVVILPRRGTIVADLNFSDLQKIFEMRIELESLAAQLAAQRATSEQIAQMESLMQWTEQLLENGDNRELIDADHQMHLLLAQAAHNEFLEETLEGLYCHVLRLWNLNLHQVSSLPKGMCEHAEILAAIKAKDSERAAEIMRVHVHHFQNEFSKVF